jgi:hypothetical protein
MPHFDTAAGHAALSPKLVRFGVQAQAMLVQWPVQAR